MLYELLELVESLSGTDRDELLQKILLLPAFRNLGITEQLMMNAREKSIDKIDKLSDDELFKLYYDTNRDSINLEEDIINRRDREYEDEVCDYYNRTYDDYLEASAMNDDGLAQEHVASLLSIMDTYPELFN